MKYCLGTVQFGLDYGIQSNGKPLRDNVFEMLNFAIDSGISVMDTAAAYGDSEKILGDYIRANPEKAEKIEIVSKLTPNAFDNADKSEWGVIAVKNAEESRSRLGIKKFAAYLFHNAAYIFDNDAVGALETVRKKGIADRIGVSIYNPEEAMKALEYPSITAIQIPYNVFDQRLDSKGFFEKAKAQDVLVFARSSLLQGLAVMNPDSLPSKVSFAEEYLRKFIAICSDYGVPPLNAAVGYVGCKNEIDYVVFGVDNISQLKEYISIRNTELPQSMVKRIRKTFTGVEEQLVNPALWK